MKTYPQQSIYYSDVDDTLIIWSPNPAHNLRYVTFRDPWNKTDIRVAVNDNMVTLLKEKKERGYLTIVHSLGGALYAEAVVAALELEKYVDICMGKPTCHGDDLEVSEWWPKRVYINPGARYKK